MLARHVKASTIKNDLSVSYSSYSIWHIFSDLCQTADTEIGWIGFTLG